MDNNYFLILKIAELEKQIEILKTENIKLNNDIKIIIIINLIFLQHFF